MPLPHVRLHSSLARQIRRAFVGAPVLVLAACGQGEPEAINSASAAVAIAADRDTAAAGVGGVESMAHALDRFRADLPVVTELANGETSRDALVGRFIRAVEHADTNDLREMMVSRPEFAFLYYPTSEYTRRPFRQAAPLVWFLQMQESQKGITRVLRRHGGASMHVAGYGCDPEPHREGKNALWLNCRLHLVPLAGADTVRLRLFGPILERDGRFKIHSFKTDL